MLKFISLRLLFALPALWLILTMVFLLAHIVPGDPVEQMLGEGARAEDLQQLRHALGLDLPIATQYGGMSVTTTLLTPMMAPSPMVTPLRMKEF